MTNAIVPYNDMQHMATAIAKSGLFGMKSPDQALALMIVAQAEGRHPGSVAQEYHIIQGRPALKSDAMLARFQAAGGKVEWVKHTDSCVVGKFSHPQGGTIEIEWTMERAKAAGLTGKDNWRTYPRQMLRARVISEGVRACYPGVAVGLYTPEEVADFAPAPKQAVRVEPRFAPPDDHPIIDVLEAELEAIPPAEVPTEAPAPEPEPEKREGKPASTAQIKAIHAFGKRCGLDHNQLHVLSMEEYGYGIDDLLVKEASTLIDMLKQQAEADGR